MKKTRLILAAAMIAALWAGSAMADETAAASQPAAQPLTVTAAGSAPPLQTGWVRDGGQWKYYYEDGTMARSAWVEDGDGIWYFLNDDGTMRTGWLQNGDDWYFFDSSGVMQTGAVRVEDRVYYLQNDGSLLVGRRSVNGIRYSFNENGCSGQMPYTSKMFHSDGTPFTDAERQDLSWNSPS